jgi:hypothetical protein
MNRIRHLIRAAFPAGPDRSGWTRADDRICADASAALKQTNTNNSRASGARLWRTIMKNRRTRLATAAVIAAAVVLSSVVMDCLVPPAWAIGQTVKALKGVRSMVIRGVGYDDGDASPFTLWIRPSRSGGEGFDMRFECADQLIVVRGKKAWVHLADKNVVMIYDDVTTSYGMMRDLRWWYDFAHLNPWVTGKVLAAAKHVAENWEEVYGVDERTGRDSVFVTCTYKPESSFWFVCDLETKLIVEAKYWNWSSPDPEGPPACHATSFSYNEDLDDALFDFQIPEGVRIIDKAKERKARQEEQVLSDRAERLHMEGKYAEAIDVYQQVHDRFPKLNNGVSASTALEMMGRAYRQLGEPAKAVEVLQKLLAEYGYLEGCESTYYVLGRAYLDMGDEEKALEAFEHCLDLGKGRREPDQYTLKQAREQIRQLKGQ